MQVVVDAEGWVCRNSGRRDPAPGERWTLAHLLFGKLLCGMLNVVGSACGDQLGRLGWNQKGLWVKPWSVKCILVAPESSLASGGGNEVSKTSR